MKQQVVNSGSALLGVMIIIFVVSLMAGSMYSFSSNQVKQASRMADSVKARSIAEAGANQAVLVLLSNLNANLPSGNMSLGGGTYTLSVTSSGDRRTVTSEGTYGDATAAINVAVEESPPEQNAWYQQALLSDGNTVFNGQPTMNGNSHANGIFDNKPNKWDGVTGLISAQNTNSIPAAIRRDYELIEFPDVSDPIFQDMIADAIAAGSPALATYNGNYAYPTTNYNAVQTVNGNLTFNQAITIRGVIMVNGNVTFNGNRARNINGILYVKGNVVFNGNGAVNMPANAGILADGNIEFNGNNAVYSIVGRDENSGTEYGEDIPPRVVAWWPGTL